MDHYLYNQLAFVRSQTLKLADGLSEEAANRIPEGFRNNIRWHLGHIYVVMARYSFKYMELPSDVPAGWTELFEFGTSPLTAPEGVVPPTLDELRDRLGSQIARIRGIYGDRIQEPVVSPYTNSSGMRLGTLEEFFSFNLYHEGMHLSTIRAYKRLLSL
jgi:DinB superfamily